MKTVTKQWLKEKHACPCGVDWFTGLNSNLTVDVLQAAVNDNKYDYFYWLWKRVADKKQSVTLAIYAAEKVIDIYESEYPDNDKPRKAILAAKAYLENPCKRTKDTAYTAYTAYAAAAAADAAAAAYAAAAAAAAAYAAAAAAVKKDIAKKAISIIKQKEKTQMKYAITLLIGLVVSIAFIVRDLTAPEPQRALKRRKRSIKETLTNPRDIDAFERGYNDYTNNRPVLPIYIERLRLAYNAGRMEAKEDMEKCL